MSKWLYFVLFVGAGLFGFAALFGQVYSHSKENAEDTSGAPQLKLYASNWKFDQPEYTVKAGDKMKVTLQIKEGIHAVEIKGLNVALDKANPSQEVTFDKPGTYEIVCTLPCGQGHADMKSKLVVQ